MQCLPIFLKVEILRAHYVDLLNLIFIYCLELMPPKPPIPLFYTQNVGYVVISGYLCICAYLIAKLFSQLRLRNIQVLRKI